MKTESEPSKGLVNKVLPVESTRVELGWHLQEQKGTWVITGLKGERQIHRDIIHTKVRRAEVGEYARKRYPLHDSEIQHSLVKSVHVSPRPHQSRLCRTIQPHLASAAVRTSLRYGLAHYSAHPQTHGNYIWKQLEISPPHVKSPFN